MKPNNRAGKNGRTPGTYKKVKGVIQRVYDPDKTCEKCNQRAAAGQVLCHDCLGESCSERVPTPEEILTRAALIREENLALRKTHSPTLKNGQDHSDIYGYDRNNYCPRICRYLGASGRRGKVI